MMILVRPEVGGAQEVFEEGGFHGHERSFFKVSIKWAVMNPVSPILTPNSSIQCMP